MIQTKLNPRYTFDSFIINNSNELAFSAALTVAQEPMKYSPIFFYGKSGTGKTHLLQALLRKFKRVHKKPAMYVTAEKFCKDIIFAIRNNQLESFDKKYRNNSLLIIDDLQLIAGKSHTQLMLVTIMKELQVKDRPIVLAADQHPYLISNLDDILRDSCFGGLMFEIRK